MPNKGNNNGSDFKMSNEPPGLNGANTVSQARQSNMSAIRLTLAPN
jgi:hypothetical protein